MIVKTKRKRRRYKLSELLKGYKPRHRHGEWKLGSQPQSYFIDATDENIYALFEQCAGILGVRPLYGAPEAAFRLRLVADCQNEIALEQVQTGVGPVLRIALGDSPGLGESDDRVLKSLRSAVKISKNPQIVRQTQLSPGGPQVPHTDANACDTLLDVALLGDSPAVHDRSPGFIISEPVFGAD